MSEKFTPGPWKYSEIKDWSQFSVSQQDGAPYTHWASDVCNVPYIPNCQPREVAEANARLISAAPEMLEALKIALTVIQEETNDFQYDERSKVVAAAIAKAEGHE